MRWLVRLLFGRGERRLSQAKAEAKAERRLQQLERRWSEQRELTDPVIAEVERVEKLMRQNHARSS